MQQSKVGMDLLRIFQSHFFFTKHHQSSTVPTVLADNYQPLHHISPFFFVLFKAEISPDYPRFEAWLKMTGHLQDRFEHIDRFPRGAYR
eukprot:scaffold444548_cov14-Prasinocladus_malaysianus.AAC.1